MLQLESRDCPAGQTWYGGEVWVGTRSERVFEDWGGELHTLDAGRLRFVAGGAVAGLAADRFGGGAGLVYQQRTVFVSPRVGSPVLAGRAVAHEAGHAFGLGHRDGPNVMAPSLSLDHADWHPDDLAALRERAANAKG